MRNAIFGAVVAAITVTPAALAPADIHAAPEAAVEGAAALAAEVAQVWAAVNARSAFVPSPNLVIDDCTLTEVLGAEDAEEVRQRLDRFRFTDCSEPRPAGATVWSLAGAMEWYGGRTVALAADVRTPSTFGRELYILTTTM